jgi:hypothetical protein
MPSGVKKLVGWLVVVLGIGLGIRFILGKWPFDGGGKEAPKPQRVEAPRERTVPDPPAEAVQPREHELPEPVEREATRPADLPPKPPEPPRIPGTTLVTDDGPQWFAVAPGVVYTCRYGDLVKHAKDGSGEQVVGSCGGAFDLTADSLGVVFCEDSKVQRVTAGTTGTKVIADDVDCIMMAVDAKYAYYVVSGHEDNHDPGVYRVARDGGGSPERIFSTRPKEQFGVVVDDQAVWISAWSGGAIYKLAKTPGAKARAVITGQKGLVDFGVDAKYLYWHAEGSGEIRRRAKSGGKIEVIGHDVHVEALAVVDGHAYWFEGKEEKRLVHLAPGATQPETLATGLRQPSLRADAEGVYITELDRDGLFMFKR